MDTLRAYSFSAPIEGVQVKPLTEDGKLVKIRYNGSLCNAGASKVYLHIGYGDLRKWNNIQDIPMDYTQDGWEQTIQLDEKQLNFCFKDVAQNWDNNNGMNWVYKIT